MTLTRLFTGRVPDSINVTARVRGYGYPAIAAYGVLHQVALGLESCVRIIEPREKHRHRVGGVARPSLRAKPDHVDSSIAADGELWPSHSTNCDRAAWLTIHAKRFRKVLSVGLTPNVFDIPARRIPLEIDHVQHAVAVQHSLWLNSFVRRAKQCNLRGLTSSDVP